MRAVLGSILVSGHRWSSRCSTCSSAAISSGVGSVEVRRASSVMPPARRAVIRSTSSRASCWRSRILSTTSAGALARNASLPSLPAVPASSFCAAARSFSSRAPFGGDVDGARRVEFDDHGAADSRTSTDADGREVVGRSGSARPAPSTADLRVEAGLGDAGQPRRHLLPVGEALVAAEPAHLGDQLLHVRNALRSNGDPARTRTACGHSAMTSDSPPVSAFHSTSVTNGITGCSSLSRVSSTAASTAVVCALDHLRRRAAPSPARRTSRRTRPRRSGRAIRRPG